MEKEKFEKFWSIIKDNPEIEEKLREKVLRMTDAVKEIIMEEEVDSFLEKHKTPKWERPKVSYYG